MELTDLLSAAAQEEALQPEKPSDSHLHSNIDETNVSQLQEMVPARYVSPVATSTISSSAPRI